MIQASLTDRSGRDAHERRCIRYNQPMGIWQQVSSLFVGSTDPSQSAALAQENPDVREVVSEVRRLRALPSEQRVLPSGRLGEAVTELLAGVERLSDPEVLRLHFAHICMYPAGLSSTTWSHPGIDRDLRL